MPSTIRPCANNSAVPRTFYPAAGAASTGFHPYYFQKARQNGRSAHAALSMWARPDMLLKPEMAQLRAYRLAMNSTAIRLRTRAYQSFLALIDLMRNGIMPLEPRDNMDVCGGGRRGMRRRKPSTGGDTRRCRPDHRNRRGAGAAARCPLACIAAPVILVVGFADL